MQDQQEALPLVEQKPNGGPQIQPQDDEAALLNQALREAKRRQKLARAIKEFPFWCKERGVALDTLVVWEQVPNQEGRPLMRPLGQAQFVVLPDEEAK